MDRRQQHCFHPRRAVDAAAFLVCFHDPDFEAGPVAVAVLDPAPVEGEALEPLLWMLVSEPSGF